MIDLSKSKSNWKWRVLIARGLWSFFVEPIVRWLPKSCSFLRVFCLRLFGAKIGSNCLILPGVKVLIPWNLELEDSVAIGRSVDIYNFASVRIRRMSVVSQRCFLCTGSHDYTSQSMPLIWDRIDIGSECWIAAEVFIAPGVAIADGVVVGARAVLTKTIENAWTVWGGHPAKMLKIREMKDANET